MPSPYVISVSLLSAAAVSYVAYNYIFPNSTDMAEMTEPAEMTESADKKELAEMTELVGIHGQRNHSYIEAAIDKYRHIMTKKQQLTVVVTGSQCVQRFQDLAERSTLAIFFLKRKWLRLDQDHLLVAWNKQGCHTKIFQIQTAEELDQLYDQVQEKGTMQAIVKTRCDVSTALAFGPAACDDVEPLLTNLELLVHMKNNTENTTQTSN